MSLSSRLKDRLPVSRRVGVLLLSPRTSRRVPSRVQALLPLPGVAPGEALGFILLKELPELSVDFRIPPGAFPGVGVPLAPLGQPSAPGDDPDLAVVDVLDELLGCDLATRIPQQNAGRSPEVQRALIASIRWRLPYPSSPSSLMWQNVGRTEEMSSLMTGSPDEMIGTSSEQPPGG